MKKTTAKKTKKKTTARAGRGRDLLISLERCDGCGECIKKCREALGEAAPGIQIVKVGDRYIPLLCQNCKDAPCVTACMPGCRHKDEETGMVITDYERCVGCWMCVMLCPFGAITRIPKKGGEHYGVARKCDGCLDQETAPCMTVCMPRGLEDIDPGVYSLEKRTKAARAIATLVEEEPEAQAGK